MRGESNLKSLDVVLFEIDKIMDYIIFQFINDFAGQWWALDAVGIFFATGFQYALCAFLLAFLILGKNRAEKIKNRWMVAAGFASAAMARLGFAALLHLWFFRARPFVSRAVNQLVDYKAGDSFPSGHAAFFFALAAAVYAYNKKLGAAFFVGAFLISLARIFVGIHYPSDVLAGALIGIFSGWGVAKILKILANKKTP